MIDVYKGLVPFDFLIDCEDNNQLPTAISQSMAPQNAIC